MSQIGLTFLSRCAFFSLALLVLPSVSATADSAAVQQLLSSPDRTAADHARDEAGKAAEMLAFFKLAEGDKVVDVFAGGGYWSELFAAAVGPSGQVLAHNNAAYRSFVGPEIGVRFQEKSLPQLAIYDREVGDLGLGVGAHNVIYMSMSFHDLYFVDDANGWPAIDSDQFIAQLHRALVDGGRLIIVDHNALPGTGASAAQALHRIDKAFVIETLAQRGFTLVDESRQMANDIDPLTIGVFDNAVKGKTSRFALIFKKVKAL